MPAARAPARRRRGRRRPLRRRRRPVGHKFVCSAMLAHLSSRISGCPTSSMVLSQYKNWTRRLNHGRCHPCW
eukprot:1414758-Prymnesium_polylepis.1